MADLTIEERRAIGALRRLAARWPATLTITAVDGQLNITHTGTDEPSIATIPCAATPPPARYRVPPSGWVSMGSSAGTGAPVELSAEVDESGLPLWERPRPTD